MAATTNEINVLLIGDGGVGKTCLAIRAMTDTFAGHGEYIPTVCDNDAVQKELSINNKQICAQFRFWDTSGIDECGFFQNRIRPLTYPYVDIALICFDRFRGSSLKNVKEKWYPEIQHYRPDLMDVLVATKCDLIPYDHSLLVFGFIRQFNLADLQIADDIIAMILEYEDMTKLNASGLNSQCNEDPITADDINGIMSLGFAGYVETSALTGDGMRELFKLVYSLINTQRQSQRKSGCACLCL